MPGYSPASNTTSNLPQATVIFYDKSFVKNLKAETPFLRVCSRRDLPENSGNQLRLFMYDTLGANTTQATEGTVGSGIEVTVQDTTPQIGEYADYASFSSLSIATAIDPVVENVAKEFGYRLGQTLSALARATADSASSVDSSVSIQLAAAAGSPATYTPLSNSVLRSATMELAGRSVRPIETGKGLYGGIVHPFALGDVLADTSTNSPIDILKHTPEGLMQLNELGGVDQAETIEFPSTSVTFFKTNQVTTTTNYKSSGLTALRTYIFGEDGVIGVTLKAKGDTPFGDGRWQDITCKTVQNPPNSVADPSGLIAGWTSYRVKQTFSLPPDSVMRLRTIDACSGLS